MCAEYAPFYLSPPAQGSAQVGGDGEVSYALFYLPHKLLAYNVSDVFKNCPPVF